MTSLHGTGILHVQTILLIPSLLPSPHHPTRIPIPAKSLGCNFLSPVQYSHHTIRPLSSLFKVPT